VAYSDEVGDSGFIRIAEGLRMRMRLHQWEPVLVTLLKALDIPISQHLMRDFRISGDFRDRGALQFRLAQIREDVVDFSVRLHVMRKFDHAVKIENHPESDLDSRK
jgi:hypothetical protein